MVFPPGAIAHLAHVGVDAPQSAHVALDGSCLYLARTDLCLRSRSRQAAVRLDMVLLSLSLPSSPRQQSPSEPLQKMKDVMNLGGREKKSLWKFSTLEI